MGKDLFQIITPQAAADRGAQVSIIAKENAKLIFDQLVANQVLGDWREPNVIRLSPVPLYNSYTDIFRTGELLLRISKEVAG